MNLFKTKIAPEGQSLSEYGLVLSLIAVVSLGGLAFFGDHFTGLFSTITRLVTGKHSSETVASTTGASASSSNMSVDAHGNTCYSDGVCLNLSQIPQTPPPDSSDATVQAAGANGSLLLAYTDVLSQLSAQTAANPNIDPGLRALITALALQGHNIADTTQKMATNEQSLSNGLDTMVKNQLPLEIASMNAKPDFDAAKSALDAYLQTNPDALPADLKTVIDSASAYISTNADPETMATNAQGILMTSYSISSTATSPTSPTTSTTTTITQDSNNICTSGGDTSTCVKN
jgi:Flp pilus assembly pilin Flp